MRESGSIKLRAVCLGIGVVLAAGGVALLFLPGPGLLLLVFAAALLAGESRTASRWLDRAEPPVARRLQAVKRRWQRLRARFRRR